MPPVGRSHVHHVVPPPRPGVTPRKRPKYTRSKTGCLTCRVKKIKCDEAKPICTRCTHGHRECTWPKGVPVRKKTSGRKDSIDGRSSTAGSSISESSGTPPTREPSPHHQQQIDIDLDLMALTTRKRLNDAYLQLQPIQTDLDATRPSMSSDRPPAYPSQYNPASNMFSMITEASYQSRYDPYPSPIQRATVPQHYRSMSHQHLAQWSCPDQMDPYVRDPYQYPMPQDRALVAHMSASDSHRYQ